jgi:PTS system nitrogen regulatory IIA component
MSISIGPVLHPAHLISELKTRRRESALGEVARWAHRTRLVREPELLRGTLWMRERLGSTAVGRGLATPNARSLLVLEPLVLLGRSRRGIEWAAPDGEPVRLVLLALSPPGVPARTHTQFVARALAVVRPARTRQRLLESECSDELAAALREVLP